MAKGFVLYSFYTGETDASEHFASLVTARKEARQRHRDGFDGDIEIERIETVPITKDSLIRILNSAGGQYSRRSEVVEVIRARREAGHQFGQGATQGDRRK